MNLHFPFLVAISLNVKIKERAIYKNKANLSERNSTYIVFSVIAQMSRAFSIIRYFKGISKKIYASIYNNYVGDYAGSMTPVSSLILINIRHLDNFDHDITLYPFRGAQK